ncbi:MAG TPA: hypothetical protein VI756_04090 [Blastocatellia bacterium]
MFVALYQDTIPAPAGRYVYGVTRKATRYLGLSVEHAFTEGFT